MGGSCTLIGTATNLVVYANIDRALQSQIGMFTISQLAVPPALVGISYVLISSAKLLPDRRASTADRVEARRYTVEMLVEPGSPLVGQTIEQAGLRNLPGVYLMQIHRKGQVKDRTG